MKKSEQGFIQVPLLIVIIASILITSTGAGVVLYNKGKLPSTVKKNNVVQTTQENKPNLTPSPSPSLKQKLQPEVSDTDESKDVIVKTSPVQIEILSPPPQYKNQIIKQVQTDPAIGIEICRTKAKEKRNAEEKKINEDYARSEPAKVELAAAQNNSETEAVALKHGIITQSQVVSRTEVFERLLSEGYPIDQAEKAATIAGDDYSSYLRSLHDWAVNELNKWNDVVKTRFDTYESQIYQNCLSSL